MNKIPFNRPYATGKEVGYILKAINSGKISGDGMFTKKCEGFFKEFYGFEKVLLTPSCTDALELAALLLDIKEGDEVIMPSYTFVSTANPFVLRGATIIFCDSGTINPNIDENAIERLITSKTKAIVIVHYAGIACNLSRILEISKKYDVALVEDAAQGVDSFYNGKPLGSFGCLAAMSFHETKNINCGEGGMLIVNDPRLIERSEIIREKGTNRSAFFRGQVSKYNWVDIGSSFLMADINAAYLYAQLEQAKEIQKKRVGIWNNYFDGLRALEQNGELRLPVVPEFATNNGHIFYFLCANGEERDMLLQHLTSKKIMAIFHYQALHCSPYFAPRYKGQELPQSKLYSDCLLRFPLYFDLRDDEVQYIVSTVKSFYGR